jgi:chromosome segregation ATPase
MNVLEKAAGSEDKVLVRNIVDAAFFIFSGSEGELPGGRDFWERMKMTAPGQGTGALPVENARARELRAFEVFRRELEGSATRKPAIPSLLPDGPDEGLSSLQRRPPSTPAPPVGPATARLEPDKDMVNAVPDDIQKSLRIAQEELRKKDALLKDYEEDMNRIYDQLKGREVMPGLKELEDKLALQEEETRMAREDLANMEKKYRENMELLKAEAHDRGELQKRILAAEGEVARAHARLGEEQKTLAETRSRLEKKEAELQKLGDQLHGTQLELVKKEEDIRMAMEHLRDEEAERRRVLEALRQEARDKAQMEHRLKKREQELELLEAKIQNEEKRVESLKGSQAVSEEESLKRSDELRRREETVHALEAQIREKVSALGKEEDAIRERIDRLKAELRSSETLEAQTKKREEARASLEARYRAKEEALVKELLELERAKVTVAERERELAKDPQWPRQATVVDEARPAGETQKADRAPKTPERPSPERSPAGGMIARRNEILEILSRRIKKK